MILWYRNHFVVLIIKVLQLLDNFREFNLCTEQNHSINGQMFLMILTRFMLQLINELSSSKAQSFGVILVDNLMKVSPGKPDINILIDLKLQSKIMKKFCIIIYSKVKISQKCHQQSNDVKCSDNKNL